MNEADVCDFCKRGQVDWKTTEMKFRQWSDKGYVHCSVEIPVGTCNVCEATSFAMDADQIFDEAFQREYRKLP